MAFQSANNEIRICFPFCCFGYTEPGRLLFLIICWDIFVFVCWFIYNLCMINLFTVAPLIISFVFILIMFPVVWDIRDPEGEYTILRFYHVIRIFQGFVMALADLTFFVLIFVYVANSSLEGTYMTKYWALGLFLFFLPVSIIHFGTVFTYPKALKYMRASFSHGIASNNLSTTLNKLNHDTSRVVTYNNNNRTEMTPQISRLGNF